MSVQRLIAEEYWSQFIIKDTKTSKKKHDGARFEELVERLLKLMYQDENINWVPTKITHDGNKDFKAHINQEIYWAECKNYNTKIDLKTLAATLVMAEIENVNVILFFCYSQINDSTKKKLNSYSRSTNKSIYFYDGQVLDQLILKYANNILCDFFPELEKEYKPENYIDISIKPTIVCYAERNPSFNGSLTFDIKKLDELQDLKIGEIIGIHVIIINNNINSKIKGSLYLSFDQSYNSFEILDDSANKKDHRITWNDFELESGATLHKIIYLKLQVYSPIVQIPKLTCKIDKVRKNFEFGTIRALETLHCAFIGQNYQNYLLCASRHCLNKKTISGILFYGRSGTGKTRIVYECCDKFLSAGYQIINFCNMQENYTSYAMLHELIFALYGFTDELIEMIIQNDYENLSNYNTPQYKEIFRILKLLYQNKSDIDTICIEEFTCLYEKLAQEKYFIAFDDLQYLPDASVNFIKGFWNYAINMKRKCLCVLAIAVNTDTLFNANTIEFLGDFSNSSLENRKNFYKHELTGFDNEAQAELFLKEVLGMHDDEICVDIKQKLVLCPKYIFNIANYLLDKKVIKTVNHKVYITNQIELNELLSTLPDSNEELIEKRWEIFCTNHIKQNYKQLICNLLFWGKLDCTDIYVSSTYFDNISELVRHNFLKEFNTNSNIYIFEHDSIKYFFLKVFPDWFELALKHIGQSKYNSHINGQNLLCSIGQKMRISEDDGERLSNFNVPENIRYAVYCFLLKVLLTQNEPPSQKIYCQLISKIFNDTREKYGEKNAERLFQIFEDTYDLTNKKKDVSFYWQIMQYYAENQLKLKSTEKAISIYSDIIENHLDLTVKSDLVKLAALYNRWFVCGRIGGYCQQFEWKWIESMKLVRENHVCNICIENSFDRAQSYMTNVNFSDKVIYYLDKGCKAYEYKQPSQLKGHYLFRQIQLLFLKKEYNEIWDKIQTAKNELVINKDIQFKLFFKIQFLIFEIMICLMNEHNYSDFILENALESLNALQCMQNRLQLYRCYYLYGKYYVKKGKWEKAYLIYEKTFENLNENFQSEEIIQQKKIIFQDMAITFRKNGFPISNFDFSFLNAYEEKNKIYEILNYSEIEFEYFLKNYTAYAIISDKTGKDGYLLF